MKKYFTSDWHLGDDRIGINGKPNLFYRPFGSIEEQNNTIINNFINSNFKDGDELWHLGDVVYANNEESWDVLNIIRHRFPNSKFNLIVGNYDEDKLDMLENYFDLIWKDGGYIHLGGNIDFENSKNSKPFLKVALNHYPIKCKEWMNSEDVAFGNVPTSFAITGHIHGLWKVQRNMINVGVDAWHFKPVSEDEILFCWNAMQNFYDENVFPY